MKNRFLIGIVFLLLLSTYQIQDGFNIGPILNIKKIIINNNSIIDKEEIKRNYIFCIIQIFFSLNRKILKNL